MLPEQIHQNMLSVGYWVYDRETDTPVQIKEIYSEGICGTDEQTYLYEDLGGIYLNADWLEVMGFFRQEDGSFKREGFPFEILRHNQAVVLFEGEQVTRLRFVHELQHLFAGIKHRRLAIDFPPVP